MKALVAAALDQRAQARGGGTVRFNAGLRFDQTTDINFLVAL
jgi:hypothetical protein